MQEQDRTAGTVVAVGDVMHNRNQTPCEHCQKAFHGHPELAYLYCGHHCVVAFRVPGRSVVFLPVSSTAEAMQVIGNAMESGGELAESA